MKKYQRVALGGTFDHLHKGHVALLKFAVQISVHVSVGISTGQLLRNKGADWALQEYKTREFEVQNLLRVLAPHGEHECFPLHDIYGVTLTNKNIQAMIVSEQTKLGAEKINAERLLRYLEPLPIEVCPMVTDDSGEHLSSTSIRKGMNDRRGRSYVRFFSKDVKVSDSQKSAIKAFSIPVSTQLPKLDKVPTNRPVVLVGDVITHAWIEKGLPFSSAYIDGKSQRTVFEKTAQIKTEEKITNPAGVISYHAVQQLLQTSPESTQKIYMVDGEEDLLATAAMMVLPLKSWVVFGQPNKGFSIVEVDEELKEQLSSVFSS